MMNDGVMDMEELEARLYGQVHYEDECPSPRANNHTSTNVNANQPQEYFTNLQPLPQGNSTHDSQDGAPFVNIYSHFGLVLNPAAVDIADVQQLPGQIVSNKQFTNRKTQPPKRKRRRLDREQYEERERPRYEGFKQHCLNDQQDYFKGEKNSHRKSARRVCEAVITTSDIVVLSSDDEPACNVKPEILCNIVSDEKIDEDDDDVVYLGPKQVEVINIDCEDEISENVAPPPLITTHSDQNDFLEHSMLYSPISDFELTGMSNGEQDNTNIAISDSESSTTNESTRIFKATEFERSSKDVPELSLEGFETYISTSGTFVSESSGMSHSVLGVASSSKTKTQPNIEKDQNTSDSSSESEYEYENITSVESNVSRNTNSNLPNVAIVSDYDAAMSILPIVSDGEIKITTCEDTLSELHDSKCKIVNNFAATIDNTIVLISSDEFSDSDMDAENSVELLNIGNRMTPTKDNNVHFNPLMKDENVDTACPSQDDNVHSNQSRQDDNISTPPGKNDGAHSSHPLDNHMQSNPINADNVNATHHIKDENAQSNCPIKDENVHSNRPIEEDNTHSTRPSQGDDVVHFERPTYKGTRFSNVWTDDMRKFYNDSWGEEDFNVEEEQKKMSDDPGMWQIISKDLVSISAVRRGLHCEHCGRFGHKVIDCNKKAGKPKCILCASYGHYESKCPNTLCSMCGGKIAWWTNYCNSCSSTRYMFCRICSMKGHLAHVCPDLWRRYHLTVSEGPIVQPQSNNIYKMPNDYWCCGCGSQGHVEHECDYRVRSFPRSNIFVNSYIDVYGHNSKLPKQRDASYLNRPSVNERALPRLSDMQTNEENPLSDLQLSVEHIQLNLHDHEVRALLTDEGVKFLTKISDDTDLQIRVLKRGHGKYRKYTCAIEGSDPHKSEAVRRITKYCSNTNNQHSLESLFFKRGLTKDVLIDNFEKLNRQLPWNLLLRDTYSKLRQCEQDIYKCRLEKRKCFKKNISMYYIAMHAVLIGKFKVGNSRCLNTLRTWLQSSDSSAGHDVKQAYNYVFVNGTRLKVPYDTLVKECGRKKCQDPSYSIQNEVSDMMTNSIRMCICHNLHKQLKVVERYHKLVLHSKFEDKQVKIFKRYCKFLHIKIANKP